MLEIAAVIVIVCVSAVYCAWKLTPGRQRLWLLEHLLPAGATRRFPALARLQRSAQAGIGGACAGCSANSAKMHRFKTGGANPTRKSVAPRRH